MPSRFAPALALAAPALAALVLLAAGAAVAAKGGALPAGPAVSSAGPPAATPLAGDPATALLAALQRRYDAVRTIRFDFTERYTNRATGKTIEESGEILVAKPSRMRWDYTTPDKKTFVLDGDEAWFFVPAEQVAYKMNTAGTEARRLPFLFLAGRGNLTRDFAAHLEPSPTPVAAGAKPAPEPAAPGATRLVLVPRVAGEDYDSVVLELDPASGALQALLVTDVLGNVTAYRLFAETEGVPAPAARFRFEPPAGIEIVDATPPRESGADPGRDPAP